MAANEPVKSRLIELTRGEELIAPSTLPWEIGNAISAMFKQKRITLAEGLELAAQHRQIAITLTDVRLDDSVRLASSLNIYAYDAYVNLCAQQSGARVLSLDGGLNEAAHRAGVIVMEFT